MSDYGIRQSQLAYRMTRARADNVRARLVPRAVVKEDSASSPSSPHSMEEGREDAFFLSTPPMDRGHSDYHEQKGALTDFEGRTVEVSEGSDIDLSTNGETSLYSMRSSEISHPNINLDGQQGNNGSNKSAPDNEDDWNDVTLIDEEEMQDVGDNSEMTSMSDVYAAQKDYQKSSQAPTPEETAGCSRYKLDIHLRKLIKRPLLPKKIEKCHQGTTGYLYILKNMSLGNDIWKIGTTNNKPPKRVQQIRNDCGVKIKSRHYSQAIPIAIRAEDLFHTHLRHFNRPYKYGKCKTKKGAATQHGEYFELDSDTTKDYVDLWSSFLLHKPYKTYNNSGELHQFWRDRLEQVPLPYENDNYDEHNLQLERWKSFITLNDAELKVMKLSYRPSLLERLVHLRNKISAWIYCGYLNADLWRRLCIFELIVHHIDFCGLYGVCGDSWVWGVLSRAGVLVFAFFGWFYYSGYSNMKRKN
jgi:T5orf172 domain